MMQVMPCSRMVFNDIQGFKAPTVQLLGWDPPDHVHSQNLKSRELEEAMTKPQLPTFLTFIWSGTLKLTQLWKSYQKLGHRSKQSADREGGGGRLLWSNETNPTHEYKVYVVNICQCFQILQLPLQLVSFLLRVNWLHSHLLLRLSTCLTWTFLGTFSYMVQIFKDDYIVLWVKKKNRTWSYTVLLPAKTSSSKYQVMKYGIIIINISCHPIQVRMAQGPDACCTPQATCVNNFVAPN